MRALRKCMVVLVLAVAALSARHQPVALEEEPGQAAATCPYCHAARGADEFCARCGRLAFPSSTPGAVRFWGDASYVIPFPAAQAAPVIAAELTDQGLVKETVVFPTGDRFTLTMKKGNARVEGHVGTGGGHTESEMEATIQDTLEDGRLTVREILGSISAESKSHLYRRLEYVYGADGLLASIRFATSFYAASSDYKKKPAAWQRHARGDIVLTRQEGRLTRIETTVRAGKRSLRGEPEYADPTVTVEEVVRDLDGFMQRIDISKEDHR